MARKLKIKHIQLEPAAYPSDTEWLLMTAGERGIYHTLIIYLYCNDGRLKYLPEYLAKMCNVSVEGFEKFWQKYGDNKFQLSSESQLKHTKKSSENSREQLYIIHKRVRDEIKRAKNYVQNQRRAGLMGAAKKWRRHNAANSDAIANETKRNEYNLNTSNSKGKSHLASNSFRFATALEKLIRPRNQSDRTAFRNLTNWLSSQIINKKFNEEIYDRILGYAKEASASARNPPAMFFATLKRELGYDKKRIREK